MPTTKEENDQHVFEVVKKFFKNSRGEPFEMTKGQIDIFRAIYEKQHPRVQIVCHTQFGKSDVCAMSVLLRASTFPEKWIILSGSEKKAKIIMEYIIGHIFDNEYCLNRFKIGTDESLERIRRERSKSRITFKIGDHIGEIMILSAEARRKSEDAGDILIGFGGENLVLDDAPLVPDNIFSKALRMIGGHKDNFLLKIGNALNRNHFYKSSFDPNYKNIVIPYQQGIEEGRISPEFIEEMRGVMSPSLFNSFYECKFPAADEIDMEGWLPLFLDTQILEAQRDVETKGVKRLGVDVAEGGGNFTAFVIRTDNYAYLLEKNNESNLMKTAERIRQICGQEHIDSQDVFVDAVGIGSGVVSRLQEMGLAVNAVKAGESVPEDRQTESELGPIRFSNVRALMYWRFRNWLTLGGCLFKNNEEWSQQLPAIKYKEDAEKRIKIISKDEMRLRGFESPDVADALAMTFVPVIKIHMAEYNKYQKEYEEQQKRNVFYPELGF